MVRVALVCLFVFVSTVFGHDKTYEIKEMDARCKCPEMGEQIFVRKDLLKNRRIVISDYNETYYLIELLPD